MSSKRVLITGGAGFIGSHLSRRLVESGHTVMVLDNLHQQVHGDAPQLELPECEAIWADVRDGDAVGRAMEGCETVYHLVGDRLIACSLWRRTAPLSRL
jgi:dTDP-L-rhamnose 4-epimerase